MEGCCGIKLFAGSSTGNLLVAEEEDIDKVFQNSSKVVAVHSEDEAILNVNKKLIKMAMFTLILFGEVMNVQFPRLEEL